MKKNLNNNKLVFKLQLAFLARYVVWAFRLTRQSKTYQSGFTFKPKLLIQTFHDPQLADNVSVNVNLCGKCGQSVCAVTY